MVVRVRRYLATPSWHLPRSVRHQGDGIVSGDDVSFSVTRTFGQNEFTTKYTFKLDGDTMKGKSEADFNGNPVTQDIEAKRGERMERRGSREWRNDIAAMRRGAAQ